MRGTQPHKNSNLSQVTWKSTTAVRCALGLQDIGSTTPNKCQAKSETASWRHPELTSQFTRVVFFNVRSGHGLDQPGSPLQE